MSRRILVMAHGHPDFSRGGAEIAAHALHRLVDSTPGWTSHFLAACREPGLRHVGTPLGQRPAPRETLLHAECDYFQFAATRPRDLWRDFAQWLAEIAPELVHLHHYTNFGVDILRVIRNTLPGVRIVLTLHEYLAICNRSGQMLKSDGSLCRRASPAECHVCVPTHGASDYLLRKLYIQSFFSLVDRFVAPSAFLKQRYVEWGLDPARIDVIENALEETPVAAPRAVGPDAQRGRFAFFGQLTPFKGAELAVQAYLQLPDAVRSLCTLDIHGGGHERFDGAFRARIDTQMSETHPGLRFCGPYAPQEMPRLMADVDWVLVPSIWWENSPVVIQDAFRHGRPVICSDIGGMAEKVRHEIDGLHARAGSATALSDAMQRAATEPGLWDRLRRAILAPPLGIVAAQPFLTLYERELRAPISTPTLAPRQSPGPAPLPQYLLVCSTGRAGSTLAMRQLATHPDILTRDIFPYETRMRQYMHVAAINGTQPISFAPEVLNGASFDPHHGIDTLAAQWRKALVDAEAEPADLAASYYRHIGRAQGKPMPRWIVEKGIGLAAPSSLLERDGTARAVLLLRDPRDTFFSMKAFNRKARHSAGFGEDRGDETMFRNIVSVGKSVSRLEKAFPGRIFRLHYERMVSDIAVLEEIFAWLGLATSRQQIEGIWREAGKRDTQAEQHSTTESVERSLGRWRDEAGPEDLALFAKFSRDVETMGYLP